MTATQILKQLESLGTEPYRKILRNHGATDPLFGVKIDELKKIQKREKKNYQLSLDLYKTKNYDAQYLAGLIADETQMTIKDLKGWLTDANCSNICGYTVAWVTAESPHAQPLIKEWIASRQELTAYTGWSTLGSLVSIKPDDELDLKELKKLLATVEKSIHQQPNLVRSAMNGFVISLGSYVKDLTDAAIKAGQSIGPISVDKGDTACKVPFSPDYIARVRKRGSIGKKRATARC